MKRNHINSLASIFSRIKYVRNKDQGRYMRATTRLTSFRAVFFKFFHHSMNRELESDEILKSMRIARQALITLVQFLQVVTFRADSLM